MTKCAKCDLIAMGYVYFNLIHHIVDIYPQWIPNTECDAHEFLIGLLDYTTTEMNKWVTITLYIITVIDSMIPTLSTDITHNWAILMKLCYIIIVKIYS